MPFGHACPRTIQGRRRGHPQGPISLRDVIVSVVKRIPFITYTIRIECRNSLLPFPSLAVFIRLQHDSHIRIRTCYTIYTRNDGFCPPNTPFVVVGFYFPLFFIACSISHVKNIPGIFFLVELHACYPHLRAWIERRSARNTLHNSRFPFPVYCIRAGPIRDAHVPMWSVKHFVDEHMVGVRHFHDLSRFKSRSISASNNVRMLVVNDGPFVYLLYHELLLALRKSH